MMMFRAIEMAHLDRVIPNATVLYLTTTTLTFLLAMAFSHIIKSITFPKIQSLTQKPT